MGMTWQERMLFHLGDSLVSCSVNHANRVQNVKQTNFELNQNFHLDFWARENKRCANKAWCEKIRGARIVKCKGCAKNRGAKNRGAKIKGARKFKGIR